MSRLASRVTAALALLVPLLFLPAGTARAADPLVVTDFETAGLPPGVFAWGNDGPSTPTITIVDRDSGGHALQADYTISQWGGWSHDLSTAQDWSPYATFGFWVKGSGSGQRIFFEIKDGGAGAGSAELWESSFVDDVTGWRHIETPFSGFTRRADFQPGGAPTDGELDLTSMWGYAMRLPVASGSLTFDDFQVYGTGAPRPARVTTDKPVYDLKEGGSATVKVVVSTSAGTPLQAPVSVSYATGAGTATPGEDYTPVSGTLTFPVGTASGATQEFRVTTTKGHAAETAETIPITLSAEGGRVQTDEAAIVIDAHGLPYLDSRRSVRDRVADLLGRMTLAEKAGQMTQAERNALGQQDDIAAYALGSLLSGGGSAPSPNTPAAWADMIDAFQLRARQTRLQIPLIYGVDAVHGHNNVIGATLLPHNIGMGATRDPGLVERAGKMTAQEVRATGIPWDFAPCVCVTRDERWGRSYESYGEDPALVSRLTTIIDGLQKAGVLATAKHYVGDGGTVYGSSTTGNYTIDQGDTPSATIEPIHLPPFEAAVKRDVGAVMPSYSSVDGLKMHADRDLITGTLKGRLGFRGFVISDWAAIDQLPGDYPSDVRTSINAGLDMIMVPSRYQEFVGDLIAEVQAGRIPMARIDDAVSRILTQKFRLGLFADPYADRSGIADVGSTAHRTLARTAVAESQVLLKNAGGLLPLSRSAKVYVAGSNANDIGDQSGGWTISWQGSPGAVTPGTTILQGIQSLAADVTYSADASVPIAGYDAGVVVVGEKPYAEGQGDVGVNGHTLDLAAADQAAIDKVCAAVKCVVLVVSGRPLIIGDRLGAIGALVAAWLPGTEGAGVADTLFGVRPYTGRLPVSWPRTAAQVPINVGEASYDPLFPYGWGLRTDAAKSRLKNARDALLKDGATAAAVALTAALLDRNWNADGSVKDARFVGRTLGVVAALLDHTDRDTFAEDDAVVSVARDLAQAGGATADATARAEHELMSGNIKKAVDLLT